jgi:aldehyde dehydrogenase (NAD+)
MKAISLRLQSMRSYYDSGVTRPYDYRVQQLQILRAAIQKFEKEINDALYTDLKKSTEEVFATETGLILAEISLAIKKLRSWMKPVKTRTNLLNFPSSSKILSEPKGVVFIIGPWNYPIHLSLLPLVGAIAAGNCIVLKPSEIAPACSAVITKLISETYSADYIRSYEGDGREIVPMIMKDFSFDHIFYTGSGSVGKIIYQLAAKSLIPVTLELGGKSPVVVESDADIKTTARRIALGKFINAGQTCVAPDYLLVKNDILEQFIVEFKNVVHQFFGDDIRKSEDYGKIINEKRFDQLISYLDSGELIFGGEYDRTDLFIAPAILKNVSPDAMIMQEEIFGPVLPVFGFDHMDEALTIINQNRNPLAFYVFTSSAEKEKIWLDNVSFGGGCVNNTIWHLSNPYLPFGGTGNSGIGAYHGKHSFDVFTHMKSVMKTPTWFDPYFKYPPFKGKLKWLRLLIK